MRIVGFLQNRNNVDNGFLYKCLYSMSLICDRIFVYDDASTEDVWRLYQDFDCQCIFGERQEFKRELFHKQALLSAALRDNPTWICWFDTDCILGKAFETRKGAEDLLSKAEAQNIARLHLHNLNLYRSENWYRVDSDYNELDHAVFWYNTGELHYQPQVGLHLPQYPVFFHKPEVQAGSSVIMNPRAQLLHFGFAYTQRAIDKYFMYKSLGQTGRRLDRLCDESTMHLEPINTDWYPDWFKREENTDYPKKIDWDIIRGFPDYNAWLEAAQPGI